MAAKFSCVIYKILALVVAMAALLFSSGECSRNNYHVVAGEEKATKYGLCQSACLEIQPNCSAWCKRIGYPKGGECVEPRVIDCCCWE